MKKVKFSVLLIFIVIPMFLAKAYQPKIVVTTGSLFEEMTDLHKLAEFPDPACKMVQYSSYDHRSRIPGGPFWFANSDGFGREPVPNFEKVLKEPGDDGIGEYLIADVKGPGAVVRLWTAAISGNIQVNIDGSDIPFYKGKAFDFFQRTYDHLKKMDSIDRDLFDNFVYQRDASYTPVPFAENLRIVWTGDVQKIHFYQVQVRLYEKGTSVVSFSPDDISKYSEVINKVAQILSDPDKHLKSKSQKPPADFENEIKPGEESDIFFYEGTAAVENFSIQLEAENLEKALRQTVLHIVFDDYPWGQVQSPAGDFFGAAPGVNPYESLPFSVKPDGKMICRYIMPFQKNVRFKLENMGDQPVKVSGTVQTVPYNWDESSMHFRARWRVNHNMISSNKNVQDLPFIIAVGKGVYVGTTSYLLNPNEVPTPYGSWWGEGDEKVFVDGEMEPSLFGTGSEDYYNYSWSSPDIFYHPYCGQPRNDGPGNRGFVTNFRWHVLDPIPFKENIRFYMELYSHEKTPGLSYARIGYHYAQPGLTDDFLPITPEDVRYLKLPENWNPPSRMGARNSVFYQAEEIVTNKTATLMKKGRLWAGNKILIWKPGKPGDKKDFIFNTDKKGKKRIYLTMALTPNSGKVSMKLDNKPVNLSNKKDIINLYRPYRTLLRNFRLETRELEPGKHKITLIYKGADEKVDNAEAGIDFIWVQDIK